MNDGPTDRRETLVDAAQFDSKNMLALDLWRKALLDSLHHDGPDLSARQMAVMLTVYLTPAPHTVRGLADTLNASKPAIVRALDTLGRLGFLRRRRDQADRRNVLVQRTVKGAVYLSEFAEGVVRAGEPA
ncbi:MAG: MarR family transcriptional regulator [Alphaproteobacteria bacterium]